MFVALKLPFIAIIIQMKAKSLQGDNSAPQQRSAKWLNLVSYYGFWALLIYMPFHIFLSQSLSLATGGLEIWKVAKDVILAVLVLFTVCLVYLRRVYNRTFAILLGLGTVYALFHLLIWAFNTDNHPTSTILGTVYNLRLPAFLLLGAGAILLNPGKFAISLVFKIVLTVSTLVAALAIVQYFLPPDILTNLGYGIERGARAAFFIDDHPDLMRVMSTLREPNALGAYLLLPIAALVLLLFKVKEKLRKVLIVLLALHLAALFLTFSRSAWLAAGLSVFLVIFIEKRQAVTMFVKRLWPAIIVLVILAVIGLFSLRSTEFFQSYVVHTTDLATSEDNSTELHFLLARQGVEAILEHPLGYGPGTAGLASIQSSSPLLTENYYIQIAYEVGIFGFGVFVAITVVVYRKIWARRDTIGMVLIACFWGYVVTNMLLHSWSNEAIAAQWWLLAGLAVIAIDQGKSVKKKLS